MLINSHNEWDPLEEVVVGTITDDVCIPDVCPVMLAQIGKNRAKEELKKTFRSPLLRGLVPLICSCLGYYKNGAFCGPVSFFGRFSNKLKDDFREAQEQLNNFAKVLSDLGIVVKRPSPNPCVQPVQTPFFKTNFQFSPTCPRDTLLVIGNTIVEANMSIRSRYFETFCYHDLLHTYFQKGGCNWVSAPKARMTDNLYRTDYSEPSTDARLQAIAKREYITKDEDIIFEAADVMRCGKDLFVQHGFSTNNLGIKWLKQFFGDKYRVHVLHFQDECPFHIDASLTPLRPGLVMANPDRPVDHIDLFTKAGWKVIEAPRSVNYGAKFGASSSWLSMNCLVIDPNTIVVEASETPMIKLLESLKFRVIPVPFTKAYNFGGSFHCMTVDVRRKGELEDYFSNQRKFD